MPDLPVTIADAVIAIILLISGVFAFACGFVHEVLAIGAWIGAAVVLVFGLPYLEPLAQRLVGHEMGGTLLAGAVLFIGAVVILSMGTRAIARRVQDSALNAVDRSLGFLFGLARGAVIICLAYLAVEWAMPDGKQPTWLRDSKSLPLVQQGAGWLRDLVPTNPADGGTTGPADQETLEKLETQRMLREMMNPKTQQSDEGQGTVGYGDRERREMERLIDSAR